MIKTTFSLIALFSLSILLSAAESNQPPAKSAAAKSPVDLHPPAPADNSHVAPAHSASTNSAAHGSKAATPPSESDVATKALNNFVDENMRTVVRPEAKPQHTINDLKLHPTEEFIHSTNLLHTNAPAATNEAWQVKRHWSELRVARELRQGTNAMRAIINLVSLLEAVDAPQEVKMQGLYELGLAAQQEHQTLRAYQIFSQFVDRYRDDMLVPEALLRQGMIQREMGLKELALSKFYAVLSTSLKLRDGDTEYYQTRALFAQSPRANGPYIKVNCAAIPENLIESEFFGHEKGAFTGATSKREGRFELAHGGTILLDEVSEVAPTVQAKLLRVLQERDLERVGGNRTIKVDVRVIATTNRRLEESVERKEFRQDLFFRLNVVPIHVPSLRERIGDVPFLADQFLKRFARKHGVRIQGFSPGATNALKIHNWPGNVRELQNVIERAVILGGDGDLIDAVHLGLTPPPENSSSSTVPAASGAPASSGDVSLPLSEIEKQHILAVLASCNDNRTKAAEFLGISIRTLRNKLNEYRGSGEANADAGD